MRNRSGERGRVMKSGDLKREKQFRKRLSQEYGVDQVPPSFFQAVEDTLDSLPDELPVKHRPLRGVLRTCAALAACALLVTLGAFWLNWTNPLVMESLPGVGQLFQQLNGTETPPQGPEESPSPRPTPDATESHAESKLQEDLPAFSAVTTSSFMDDYPAHLTVTNAWSDGIYLHLDLELLLEDGDLVSLDVDQLRQFYNLLSTCPEFDLASETSVVTVNGNPAQLLDSLSDRAFSYQELVEGNRVAYQTSWTLELAETYTQPTALDVNLSLPYVGATWSDAVKTGDSSWETYPDFLLDFSVTCDPTQNFQWTEPVEDNGVTLQQVENSPSCLQVSVDVPFFGRSSYTMLSEAETSGFDAASAYQPLGIYAVMTNHLGGTLTEQTSPYGDPNDYQQLDDLSNEGPYHLTFSYAAPSSGTPWVVLTLYEYPRLAATEGEFIHNNRVVAEFTIDLENHQVYSSQHYREKGLEQLPLEESLAQNRAPTPINGYICTSPSHYADQVEVALYTQDMDYRPVAVYAYWNDVLLRISYAYPPADYNASEDAFDWEGNPYTLSYYADENGAYREDVLTSPAVQTPYKRLRFTFTGTSSFSFTRLALVDTETGEELIPDIQRAYYQQVDQVFGTHLEESTYLSTTPEPLG